jgi:hypothetical protein
LNLIEQQQKVTGGFQFIGSLLLEGIPKPRVIEMAMVLGARRPPGTAASEQKSEGGGRRYLENR